jgi:hypothetical protein
MANGRRVAAFPAEVTLVCVLSTRIVATQFRVRRARTGSMPGYEYVPVDAQFTAPHSGAYEIHVERNDVPWYLGFYRVALNRRPSRERRSLPISRPKCPIRRDAEPARPRVAHVTTDPLTPTEYPAR